MRRRFRQVVGGADLLGPRPRVGGGGQHHDRRVWAGPIAVDPGEGPAIHHRHAHVEQNERHALPLDQVDGFAAVLGREHGVALVPEGLGHRP
jgi:hypothetical protein